MSNKTTVSDLLFTNPLNFIVMSKATTTKVVYISAVNGQYVSKPYAASHPNTTVKMVVKKP